MQKLIEPYDVLLDKIGEASRGTQEFSSGLTCFMGNYLTKRASRSKLK